MSVRISPNGKTDGQRLIADFKPRHLLSVIFLGSLQLAENLNTINRVGRFKTALFREDI